MNTLLFDLDGTLLDIDMPAFLKAYFSLAGRRFVSPPELPRITPALAAAARKMGLPRGNPHARSGLSRGFSPAVKRPRSRCAGSSRHSTVRSSSNCAVSRPPGRLPGPCSRWPWRSVTSLRSPRTPSSSSRPSGQESAGGARRDPFHSGHLRRDHALRQAAPGIFHPDPEAPRSACRRVPHDRGRPGHGSSRRASGIGTWLVVPEPENSWRSPARPQGHPRRTRRLARCSRGGAQRSAARGRI